MKFLLRPLLATLLLSTLQPVHAITTRGAPACSAWLSQRVSPDGEAIELSWIVGYLSGLAIGFNEDILGSVDNPTLSAWLDKYCRAHPLDSLAVAGQELFVELARKRGR
jgi:hypothetical protein